MKKISQTIPFIVALLVVLVWGVAFICSKQLVIAGLSPHEVYLLRALIAYTTLLLFSHKQFLTKNWKDECLFALLGIFGGSLYYVLENHALSFSYATNVALIVSCSPLLTTLLAILFCQLRFNKLLATGATLALLGMTLVIFNGNFTYKISWLGDFIAIGASLSWATYSLLVKKVSEKYDVLFMTRKVFFYGIITVLPLFLVKPFEYPLSGLFTFKILSNLLFLALISSLACFVGWNYAIRKIGAVRASNIVYLEPIFTFLASLYILDESYTIYSLIGAILILFGVYLSELSFRDIKI